MQYTLSITVAGCGKRTLFCKLWRRVIFYNNKNRLNARVILHYRVRSVSYKCVKIDVTKENYDNFQEIVDDKHCNILRKPPIREICHGQCDPTRWEYTEWSEVCNLYLYKNLNSVSICDVDNTVLYHFCTVLCYLWWWNTASNS